MARAVKRVALAIREQDKRTVENEAREIEYADVRRINPLNLELHGSRISLDEEDDLTLSQWVRSYDGQVGIKRGDTLAVKQMRSGRWLVTDIINEEESLFTGGGTVEDGSITSAKIADSAITSAKIADGTITNADVNASASISESKLNLASDAAAGTASRRTLGTGATQACAGNDARLSDSRTPSGSAGGDLSGTFPNPTLANDSVTAAKIATDAVGSSEIAAGAVGTPELADDSVTAAKIAVTYEAQTGATFTPVTGDMGKLVGMDSGSPQTVTIDGNLNLSTGDRIDFIQLGAGQVTFQGSGATLNGTPGLKTRARYSAASVVCVGTDVYVLVGDLAS